MSHTPLSAQQLYDAGPLGALVRFSDGAVEPPQRHRRKHAAWRTSNGTGRLVRKAPQRDALPASFTLHVGDFSSDDVTVVKAYRVFAVARMHRHTVTGTAEGNVGQSKRRAGEE